MATQTKESVVSDISSVIESAPAVTVAGVTVVHNTQGWRVCTNRHRETWGGEWGWIEGAPGNVCWSSSKHFNRAAADRMVAEHAEWLEQQKSPAIRLVESRQRWVKAKAKYDDAKDIFDKAAKALAECDADLIKCAAEAHP